MSYKVNIIIEKDEKGYYAYSPDLKGCHSQGDNFEEAYRNIKEAVELYIETLTQDEAVSMLNREIFTSSYEVAFA